MTAPNIFLEISSLSTSQPSGIPALVRSLTRFLLRDCPDRAVFCHRDKVLKPAVIIDLLAQEHGAEFPYLAVIGDIYRGTVTDELRRRGGKSAGIFPLARPAAQQFDHETQLICDLTPVLFPDWHTAETCATFSAMLDTLPQSDLIVAISESARRDLLTHTALPPAKVMVSLPGLPPAPVGNLSSLLAGDRVTPFLLVLGTVEPRKNIGLLLRFLASHPEILHEYTLVVAGRDGWGPTLAEQVTAHQLPTAKILHLGYITELEKQVLLGTTAMLIFPSLYEGFGLPVLEALAAGCPVLAANAGGIPEAGGDAAAYFVPDSDTDFSRAFLELQRQLTGDGRTAMAARGRAHAAQFSEEKFARAITTRITTDLAVH